MMKLIGTTLNSVMLATLLFACQPGAVHAQETPAPAPSVIATTVKTAAPQDANRRYRIGVGDEIEIQVFRHPQYSQNVKVNEFGVFLMPRIEEPINAVCKTENELAEEIKTHYSKYIKQPFVRVIVRNFQSQPVAIIGAVEKPGQLYVNRKMRLMEVVALAGGPNKEAGARLQLARMGTPSLCDQPAAEQTVEQDLSKLLFTYSLKKTLEGDEASNPWMQPGDIIHVLESDRAFVVGNVKEPKPILLKTPRTVTQAIAEAGDVLPATKLKNIFLIRHDASGNKTKIPMNLLAIKEGKAEDPTLQPNDIIEVPLDGGKQTRQNIFKAFTNGLPSVLPFLIP